jgi:hypothetical protein
MEKTLEPWKFMLQMLQHWQVLFEIQSTENFILYILALVKFHQIFLNSKIIEILCPLDIDTNQ